MLQRNMLKKKQRNIKRRKYATYILKRKKEIFDEEKYVKKKKKEILDEENMF